MHLRKFETLEEMQNSLARTFQRNQEMPESYGDVKYDHLVAYDLDRMFGGPEEGGWWYDAGDPLHNFKVTSEEDVKEACKAIWDEYKEQVTNSRPYTSAAGGFDVEIAFSFGEGQPYPEEAPRYS